MATAHSTPWRKIPVTKGQLCLATVLRCGQSFRWKNSGEGEWSCGFKDRIISLRQDESHLHFRASYPKPPSASKKKKNTTTSAATNGVNGVKSEGHDSDGDDDGTESIVRDYLNLNVDLEGLYEKWSLADKNFKAKAGEFRGVRMLRQPPFECLLSFICSSNNNISRIGQMVDKLCSNYGKSLGSIEHKLPPLSEKASEIVEYFSFPEPQDLTDPSVESTLRQLGFGYRAKYIWQTACSIANDRPKGWLETLRDKSTFREAHDALLELSGVGPKVADCVCLMGLDKCEAVPVDTHVWQIAQRDYKFGKSKHKSLTAVTYNAIGDHFRTLWGNEAGWAHSVLFTADLRSFSDRLESTKTKTKVKVEVEEKLELETPPPPITVAGASDPETTTGEGATEEDEKKNLKITTTTRKSITKKRSADGGVKVEQQQQQKVEIVEEFTTTLSGRRIRRRRG